MVGHDGELIQHLNLNTEIQSLCWKKAKPKPNTYTTSSQLQNCTTLQWSYKFVSYRRTTI